MTATATLEPAPGTPGAAVEAARAALEGLEHVLWAARTPQELADITAQLERVRSRVAAVEAEVMVELDANPEAGAVTGWGSSADFHTAVAGGRKTDGSRFMRMARRLAGACSSTLHALHAGTVSPEQAAVIARVIHLLPVDPDVRRRAEARLLLEATRLNASELEEAGDHLLELLDPEGVAKREEKHLDRHERSAHLGRHLSIVDDGLGGVRVRGRGSVEDAAVIKAALATLSAPLPGTDPDCGAEARDVRDYGARLWDALVEACQRLQDADVLPTAHGTKARVAVTVDIDALRSGLGAATLESGDRLSAAAVRKLACDADVLPVVLGSAGQVLDVGRAARLVTVGIWLALIARDRHCAFPGCRRQPIACDAHHIHHWADGGPTSLDNMVLLCRAHHTLVHTTRWEVRLSPRDRLPEFKPPPGRYGITPEFRASLDDRDDWLRERRPREERYL
jgi:hypothetical protein